jgi:hypothetical protein
MNLILFQKFFETKRLFLFFEAFKEFELKISYLINNFVKKLKYFN